MGAAKILMVYWHEKGYSAQAMHQQLLEWVSPLYPADSTFTNWIKAIERDGDISTRASGRGGVPDDIIDLAIAGVLKIAPFHSVRSSASIIKRPRTTVW
jgi:hypothetical protein